MAKKTKKRAEKYDPKLKIEGEFDDVIGVSVGQIPHIPENPESKETTKKPPGKKSNKKM